MDKHILKAKWLQIRGRSRIFRGRIMHNQRDRFTGRYELLMGKIREKYSSSQHKAAREIDHRIPGYKSRFKQAKTGSKSR